MSLNWTLTSSGAAIVKAGTNANVSIIASGARMEEFANQAQGRIESETRRSWVSNFADLSTGIKGALSEAASSAIAIDIINFDTAGYFSGEAELMLNVQSNKFDEQIRILKDFKSNELKVPS